MSALNQEKYFKNEIKSKIKSINSSLLFLRTELLEKNQHGMTEIYPMTESQPAQIDCRIIECKYHVSLGCVNLSPAITLNSNGEFSCWSKKER